jgi:hypothetical protein
MAPLPQSERAARMAELALSVALLTDIAAGNAADVDPDHARLFAEQALEAVVGAEIVASREASR